MSIWLYVHGAQILTSNVKKRIHIIVQTGIINNFCQLLDPEGVRQELNHLKSLQVDGVVVECWWGIVEGWNPQKYNWSGYRELFNIIREFELKLQVLNISLRHIFSFILFNF